MSNIVPPYPYPVTNQELIKTHSLEKHFEGGYFAQTVVIESSLPSDSGDSDAPQSAALQGRKQVASGSGTALLGGGPEVDGEKKLDASLIYYLLTPDSYRGRMHMNLHSLFVPGGWWKASEIPDEDLLLLDAPDAKKGKLEESIGCLISEVVVPGWNPDQHQFINEDKVSQRLKCSLLTRQLKAMWGGQTGWEQYTKYIQAPEGLEYLDK
ncbi:uncharacterized protein IL334_007792 [Kwoniella shivajii]|uniref:DUF985 domain-containing protein n=1 Tax=Kwoniella shivajii TaxID=564305 RepID=A0ABZ1D9N8_9TREE|nr:hypothetical protein IL334_007792 [Kwoniella shivajii]